MKLSYDENTKDNQIPDVEACLSADASKYPCDYTYVCMYISLETEPQCS